MDILGSRLTRDSWVSVVYAERLNSATSSVTLRSTGPTWDFGYALKAGQLTYDCRYSTMHGMPVTGGRGFRGLKPLWYNGVPP
jgi:hypothetical protein